MAGIETIQPRIGTGFLVERGVLVHDVDHGQVMPFADLIVVGVVTRRDLERPGAEGRVHILIGDHGDFPVEHGDARGLAHQLLVSFVVRVDGHRGIAQDGFRAGGADFDEAAVGQRIAEGIEPTVDFLVFHFQVADGAFAARAPVNQIVGAVDQPLVVELDKGFQYGVAEAVVQRETLALPVARNAHALLLRGDAGVIFVFPVPDLADKGLATHVVAAAPLPLQHAFHHVLRGDARMVRAGDPQRRVTQHAVIADERVFDAVGDGVAQMQRTSDVGGRHGDDKRPRGGVGLAQLGLTVGPEVSVLFPPFVELFLHHLMVIGLGHGDSCFWHNPWLSSPAVRAQQKTARLKDEAAPRYHLD